MNTSTIPPYVAETARSNKRGAGVATQLSIVIVSVDSFLIVLQMLIKLVWYCDSILGRLWHNSKLNWRGKHAPESRAMRFDIFQGRLAISHCTADYLCIDHISNASFSSRHTKVNKPDQCDRRQT